MKNIKLKAMLLTTLVVLGLSGIVTLTLLYPNIVGGILIFSLIGTAVGLLIWIIYQAILDHLVYKD